MLSALGSYFYADEQKNSSHDKKKIVLSNEDIDDMIEVDNQNITEIPIQSDEEENERYISQSFSPTFSVPDKDNKLIQLGEIVDNLRIVVPDDDNISVPNNDSPESHVHDNEPNQIVQAKYYPNSDDNSWDAKLIVDNKNKQINVYKIHLGLKFESLIKQIKFDDIIGFKKVCDTDNFYIIYFMPKERGLRTFQMLKLDLTEEPFILKKIMDQPPKNILFFVNPNSGKGSAIDNFRGSILPNIMASNNIKVAYYYLSTKKECYENIKNSNFSQFDYYAIMGGDGTVTEIINYLTDFDKLKPVVLFPCGTYNAIYRSLYSEMRNLEESTFALLKGQIHNHKLVNNLILSNPVQSKFAINTISWGFPSDIDYDTSNLRFFGKFRLTLGTFFKSFSTCSYKGRFSYLPIDAPLTKEQFNLELSALDQHRYYELSDNWSTIQSGQYKNSHFLGIWISTKKHTNDGLILNDYQTNDKEYFRILIIRYGIMWPDLLSAMIDLSKGNIPESDYIDIVYAKAFILEPHNKPNSNSLMVDGEPIKYSLIRGKYAENSVQIIA